MNAPARKPVCHILEFADGGRLLVMVVRKARPSALLLCLLKRARSWIAASIGLLASVIFSGAQAQVAPTALPTDGRLVSGQASVSQNGARMDVRQDSAKAILNWGSFNIGAQAHVNFAQPSTSAVALNRVLASDASQIHGRLSANGQVFLLNPNGVLFGPNARVDVGGFVASTLAIKDSDFLTGKYRFTRDGASGRIVNQGTLTAVGGGYVALLSPEVRNQGVIQATLGTVALAGGEAATLKFNADALVSVSVDPAKVKTLIESSNLVRADGGTVIMSAKAADELTGAAIQTGGLVAADTLQSRNGQIVLDAGSNGAVEISGALSAQGKSQGAHGGGSIRIDAGTLNNRGQLSAKDISLTGGDILQQGRVTAPAGSVSMNARYSTYLDGTVDVSDPAYTGGSIMLSTGKLEGMKGASLRADGQHGGNIHVQGSGMVAFSTTLSATGAANGGSIAISGPSVYLLNADVDASGGTQGGKVHLGGGWRGGGPLPHAREVFVGVGSRVRANGTSGGQASGGEIVVWSTQTSEQHGSLQARDGGRIELSSQGEIRQTGDLQAGPGGTVLFDPKNLVITDTPPESLVFARKVVSGSLSSGEPELSNGDQFGFSVALEGALLAVGAPFDGLAGDGGSHGAVHLFTGVGTDFSGLTWQKKLASASGAAEMPPLGAGDRFGFSVALDGDKLAVGAIGDNQLRGAVHLFSGVGTDFSALTWRKKLASSTGASRMPELQSGDQFGSAVALNGDRLVVGAPLDDTGGTDRGAAYLFTGVGADFSALDFRRKLASGTGAIGMPALANVDHFGFAVALDGDRLAVGADRDDTGSESANSERGAVHLFTGAGADFSALTWRSKLASGINAVGMPAIPDGSVFGRALSLKGDRLVVGAPGDETGRADADRGAVYFFDRVGVDFSGLSWHKTLVSGTGATNMPTLAPGDWFGFSVALDGNKLAVGARGDDAGGGARGAVYLFTGMSSVGSSVLDLGDATFAANPAGTSYIKPGTITRLLNSGTSVALQANNDVTVNSPVTANNEAGSGGNLMLQAGRNIAFNASVMTDSGSLTAVAGDLGADPAYRDSGTPTLTIGNGTRLNVGSGTATLAAVVGNIVNNAGDGAIQTTGAGRWLAYAADPATTAEGFATSSYNKHYNQAYTAGSTPAYAGSGNWFFYSLAPTLSVTPGRRTITYGDVTPTAFSPSYTGFIDGDAATTAGINGTPNWALAGPTSAAGYPTAGPHNVSYTDGLASSLGYRFADNAASRNELTVEAKALTAAYTASNKVYDGTTTATVVGSSAEIITGDVVGFTQNAAFVDKNVGVAKTVNVTDIALVGADAANYALLNNTATTTADIIARALSVTARYTASNKVYDGTTAATVVGSSTDIIAGDTVSFSQNAAFIDKNVGVAKRVNVTDIALVGEEAANYSLVNTSATAAADIAAKPLTARYTASNKVYDGTAAATVVGSSADIVAGDTVSFSQKAAFVDKNAALAKTVNVTDITLAGADAANYALLNTTATSTADIIAKALTIAANDARISFNGRPYAGGNGVTYAGFVNGETPAVLGGTPVYGGSAQGAVIPGNYLITPSGLSSTNYQISYVDGTLTIGPIVSVDDPGSVQRPIRPPDVPTPEVVPVTNNPPVLESWTLSVAPDLIAVGEAPVSGAEVVETTESEAAAGRETAEGEAGEAGDAELGRRLAALAVAEEARHRARTDLYKQAVAAIRANPAVADVPDCDGEPSKDQQRKEACIPRPKKAVAQAETAPTADEPRRKLAILFGNNAYKGKIPRLQTPIYDVMTVSEVLQSHMGYDVRVVRNASKRDTIATLKELAESTTPEDSVLIMYAGHGYLMDDTKQGFWIPVDANHTDARTWISNNDIYRLLGVILAKQVILISDSCFSGTLTKEQKLETARAAKKEILRKRSVVAMSSGDETPVADVGLDKHSVFAYHLIKRLRGGADDEAASELLDAIRAQVRKVYPQDPQIGGVVSAGHTKGGDYLFLHKD